MKYYPERPVTERPCAAEGYISYRCKGSYGWIMIGAKDDDDAMKQALRSSPFATRDTLEVWNAKTEQYEAVA